VPARYLAQTTTSQEARMRLLVFLHGPALMHPGAVGRTRQQRVAQVRAADDPTLHDYGAHVPVGEVVAKLRGWQRQGAQIGYLGSHRDPDDVAISQTACGSF
jgi:hypothetical protein